MTSPVDATPPKASVESVLAEFDGKKDVLAEFCSKTKTLIEAMLEDAGIRYQSVQARVKDKKKLREKYLDPKKNYCKLDEITDQAALRVITYYEDEVDRVADVIKREFAIDPDKSVDKRETEPDKFGYYALNYVCEYPERRTSQVEYKKFANVQCEIQIVSILRHAWSEIEHPWYDLKEAFPPEIRRRFARMAALMEIAESEFLNLRKIQSEYQRSIAVQVEAQVPDIPVDAVSIKSFIERDRIVREIDTGIAALRRARLADTFPDRAAKWAADIANLAGMKTLQEVRSTLLTRRYAVLEFVRRCGEFWPKEPPGQVMGMGASVIHLSMLLLSARGEEPVRQALGVFGTEPTWDINLQVQVAKDILPRG